MTRRKIIEGEPKLVVPGTRDFEEAGFDAFHRRPIVSRAFGGLFESRSDPLRFEQQNQDAIVTNAKIANLSANKIITGTLAATTQIDVGPGTGFIRLIGSPQRILMNDGTNNRLVIGDV